MKNKPAAAQGGFDIPVQLQMLDEAQRMVHAQIRRVSPAVFELSCPEQVPIGQRLAVTHEGRRIEVEVSESSRLESGLFHLAAKVVRDAMRSELRIPTELTGLLTVAGKREEFLVRVVDMSPSGMGLEAPVSLPHGAKVCIHLDQGLAFGEVRYCQAKAAGGYVVGFRLEQYIGRENAGPESGP